MTNTDRRYEVLKNRATKNRTPLEALAWLDDRYTGVTRVAMRHQMACSPEEAVAEVRLRRDLWNATRRAA